MQQQQHIQAIMKIVVKRESDAFPLWDKAITAASLTELLFLDGVKVCFIFLFLIYFSLLFIRVGVGTCFPIRVTGL